MKTTDNNKSKPLIVEDIHRENLQLIADIKIRNVTFEGSPNLLVFPSCINKCPDKIGDEMIFKLEGNNLHTGNIMGFVGVNDSELKIRSRFAQKDDHDYFLHYLLQKVFCINLFDMKHKSSNRNEVFDFLLYLFPYFLKKALRQGLFKEYQNKEYNNANVRGIIDIVSNIQRNVPFAGKIAYRTREYCYDNRITQLVRHTIEYIRQHPFAGNILRNDDDILKAVNQITFSTPTYNYRDRNKVINNNLNPLSHSFYYEYRELQQICLRILRSEKLKYGTDKNKVYGVLFDGAWLWEEYLYTLLKKYSFFHPENKNSKGAIFLFEGNKYPRYPDFWKKDIILDAKYKRLDKTSNELSRDDLHQIISYMYIMQARIGGCIFPKDSGTTDIEKIGDLKGYGGRIYRFSIAIPQNTTQFSDFIDHISKQEAILINNISDTYNKIK